MAHDWWENRYRPKRLAKIPKLFFKDYLTCRYKKRSIKANTSTDLICCARDESRTHTSQLTLAPETSASTISPPAQQIWMQIYEFFLNFQWYYSNLETFGKITSTADLTAMHLTSSGGHPAWLSKHSITGSATGTHAWPYGMERRRISGNQSKRTLIFDLLDRCD